MSEGSKAMTLLVLVAALLIAERMILASLPSIGRQICETELGLTWLGSGLGLGLGLRVGVS